MKKRARGIGLRAWSGGLNGRCGSRQGLFGSLGPGKNRDLQSSKHEQSKNAMHELMVNRRPRRVNPESGHLFGYHAKAGGYSDLYNHLFCGALGQPD